MSKLPTRRDRFAANYVRSGNASQAAREAGYAARGSRVTGCRLLADPNVLAAVRTYQREHEAQLAMSRDRLLQELLEAVELARTKQDPGAMIAGWREIGRICGYYTPEREAKVHVNIAAKRVIDRMETMSDTELIALCDETGGGSSTWLRPVCPICPIFSKN